LPSSVYIFFFIIAAPFSPVGFVKRPGQGAHFTDIPGIALYVV
jgi:hypothetical protein